VACVFSPIQATKTSRPDAARLCQPSAAKDQPVLGQLAKSNSLRGGTPQQFHQDHHTAPADNGLFCEPKSSAGISNVVPNVNKIQPPRTQPQLSAYAHAPWPTCRLTSAYCPHNSRTSVIPQYSATPRYFPFDSSFASSNEADSNQSRWLSGPKASL